ncbi:hypothetical protein PVK06_040038 [Gossypium arboreum]|uniref:Uncharacterized protein n=1 Tax=Gossypium arboreum TaxID=29729 RepID=A0ABR0N4E9_GOSAR|nr:hypothetical protein PVK06_040038 [Gossypium arboreum]
MDFDGKQDRKRLPVSLDHVIVQETEVKISFPTSGGGNSELGIEALTLCLDCKKKRDHSSLRLEPRSVKRVKTRLNLLACEHCKGYHLGKYRRKSKACLRCKSKEHQVRDCQVSFNSGGNLGENSRVDQGVRERELVAENRTLLAPNSVIGTYCRIWLLLALFFSS